MKVIIIKDCKNGKKDQIIEVSDGYAKNFLIKQKFAVPVNKTNSYKQSVNVANKASAEAKILENAQKMKEIIEKLELTFHLKATNLVVHGSITRKQIHQALLAKGLKMDTRMIENTKINSFGISKVSVQLHKNVRTILQVKVLEDGK